MVLSATSIPGNYCPYIYALRAPFPFECTFVGHLSSLRTACRYRRCTFFPCYVRGFPRLLAGFKSLTVRCLLLTSNVSSPPCTFSTSTPFPSPIPNPLTHLLDQIPSVPLLTSPLQQRELAQQGALTFLHTFGYLLPQVVCSWLTLAPLHKSPPIALVSRPCLTPSSLLDWLLSIRDFQMQRSSSNPKAPPKLLLSLTCGP